MLRSTLIHAGRSPFLRRQMTVNPLARRVAGRFIAGDTLDQAVPVTRALAATGATVALDFLGENTTGPELAAEAAASYLAALDRVRADGLAANVSVKLSALGLDLDPALAAGHLGRLCAAAAASGAMVGVDMESHEYVDRTLTAVAELHARHPYGSAPGPAGSGGIGVCLQAYLYRTGADLADLNARGVPVRLVKGAYAEPDRVARAAKADVDRAYARLLDDLLAGNAYPMVATHDPALVARAKTVAGRLGRDRSTWEFQMLYGIRRDLQRDVLAEGYRLRVYVPYGDQWYPYFMRRLAERPANLGFFAASLVRR